MSSGKYDDMKLIDCVDGDDDLQVAGDHDVALLIFVIGFRL